MGQVVATGNFKMVPTKDKEYENNNKGVQKQVKAAKIEAQRKTRNSKDKDYYVRVDGKNKTVTVEESKRPKGYGSYLYKSLVLDPIESFHNFHEAKKAAFHGNIGGAFKNTLKGIGNLTSPFTLGVGSWAGDNYARFKPEEVQYGTREEVLKRKQTENLLVSTPIDMTIGFATSKISVKKITSSKIKNPVTRTTTTESRATRKGATVLEEGSESIGNINNRTHSSLNNSHRSTGEKSYTLNSEKSNWKFKPEIPRTAVKNSEGNYTLGRSNEWSLPKTKTPYVELGNKGQGLVSVPSYNAVTNDYSRNYDIFYRSISEKHYNRLMETGNIPPKKETSITQNFSYSSGYQEKYGGMTVEIKTKPGTLRVLEEIGVKNNSASIIDDLYPNMKQTFSGWEKMGRVQFKQEKGQITINLGKGNGLDIFNQSIKEINLKKE